MSDFLFRTVCSRALAGAVAGCALLGGCGLKGEDLSSEGQQIVADTNEADVTIGISSELSALPALALTGTEMTLNKAVTAQTRLPMFALPLGCLTTTVAENVVTYTFNQCTGPWGLVKVSGEEVATFSPGDGPAKLVVDLKSTGLEVSGKPASHDAHVELSVKDGVRTIDWSGDYSGTSLAGHAVSHKTDLKLVMDPNQCVTLNGTTDSKVGLRGLTTTYQNIERCGAPKVCPTGTIVGTGDVSKYRVTLTFDGTTEGLATGRLGGEKSFAIDCTEKK